MHRASMPKTIRKTALFRYVSPVVLSLPIEIILLLAITFQDCRMNVGPAPNDMSIFPKR